jgi:hypothetical protein
MRSLRSVAVVAALLVLLTSGELVLPDGRSYATAQRAARRPPADIPDQGTRLRTAERRIGDRPRRSFNGHAFDTCTAPSLRTMRRWWDHSPYGAVGIYIGGANRACRQPRLTRSWVRSVDEMGWRLLPVYVGLQAPCHPARHRMRRIDPRHAQQQGREQAADAVRKAARLGISEGSPIYLDVEAYPRRAACGRAVVDFATGWTRGTRSRGYWSGFYSSTGSGVADLAAAHRSGRRHLPEVLWFARWNGRASTHGGPKSGPAMRKWPDRRRIHQYHGNVREVHGGAALRVDRNMMHALVAVVD